MVVTDCLKGHLLLHGVTNVDDVVSDDAEADPAGYSDVAIVAAATSPFDDADGLARGEHRPLTLVALLRKRRGALRSIPNSLSVAVASSLIRLVDPSLIRLVDAKNTLIRSSDTPSLIFLYVTGEVLSCFPPYKFIGAMSLLPGFIPVATWHQIPLAIDMKWDHRRVHCRMNGFADLLQPG